MNLEHLFEAVELVRNCHYRANASEVTFLRTYPVLLATAQLPAPTPTEDFLRTASLAYAWMPQTLRLDTDYLTPAADAFERARHCGVAACDTVIDPIAACLSSLVGAARVLHLVNPAIFPLWDQRIERFRLNEDPTPYHMGQTRSYLNFIQDI